MVTLSTDKLVEMLRRSGLVENDQLDQALHKIEREGGVTAEEDGQGLAEKLIAAKIITAWQRDQLLEGRYKGFFLGGKYKLLGLLGTGGMSSVYLAEHSKMQRLVAIKHLPQRRVNDSSYLARFYREAQAAAKLDHKNIVRAYDIDQDGNNHFLVMEYVEGRDLQTLVKEVGPVEYDIAAEYIRQAAEGLEHAHLAGLVHRDIKPANLLVDQRGTVKVLDLGLARLQENDKQASLTIAHEENVLGTADYLAPEQARDSHTADKRADIYSLGCTLYFLLTGHPPFPDGTLAQRIWKHQNQMPNSVYEERKDAPPPLVDVCLRMMSKQAEARYQSAGEVAQVLGKWLQARAQDASGSFSGSSIGRVRRPIGPPPRRTPSFGRSGPMPIPPRRSGDKTNVNDDTVSNINRETIKGTPSKSAPPGKPSTPASSPSHIGFGSGILGPSESSIKGGGASGRSGAGKSGISGLGGSNVLGKSGTSGIGRGVGMGSSLPVAKSLDITKSPKPNDAAKSGIAGKSGVAGQQPAARQVDSLGNLIEEALRERKTPAHMEKRIADSQGVPIPQPSSDASWIWFAVGGGVLFIVLLAVLIVLRLQ
jgi:serine/threonine-protein kinase